MHDVCLNIFNFFKFIHSFSNHQWNFQFHLPIHHVFLALNHSHLLHQHLFQHLSNHNIFNISFLLLRLFLPPQFLSLQYIACSVFTFPGDNSFHDWHQYFTLDVQIKHNLVQYLASPFGLMVYYRSAYVVACLKSISFEVKFIVSGVYQFQDLLSYHVFVYIATVIIC